MPTFIYSERCPICSFRGVPKVFQKCSKAFQNERFCRNLYICKLNGGSCRATGVPNVHFSFETAGGGRAENQEPGLKNQEKSMSFRTTERNLKRNASPHAIGAMLSPDARRRRSLAAPSGRQRGEESRGARNYFFVSLYLMCVVKSEGITSTI